MSFKGNLNNRKIGYVCHGRSEKKSQWE